MVKEDEGRISSEKARALFREDGIEVDVEQAEAILDFLYAMAEIAVDCYLDKKDVPDADKFPDIKVAENEHLVQKNP